MVSILVPDLAPANKLVFTFTHTTFFLTGSPLTSSGPVSEPHCTSFACFKPPTQFLPCSSCFSTRRWMLREMKEGCSLDAYWWLLRHASQGWCWLASSLARSTSPPTSTSLGGFFIS